ncbi:MAG: hypothetical protein A3K19_06055 [Lentisphaerae bacterium RIFOXYB12_FULL_65_16]|nr:MAG: hypothetical protein A3K18_34655 [Lentisphaerae bacterium RIFOXYA12_64_32]OGV94036.1 MAG: hypothetical protein A3K19_06055 [Lentisphaerae bacterium RIFOXYB12_FULL_65_16]
MLTRSFCHFRGVKRDGERHLWRHGILGWDDVERGVPSGILSPAKTASLREQVAVTRQALLARDAGHFLTRLPVAERPRVLGDFAAETGYLDIETDGLYEGARVTTVALFSQDGVRVFVRGQNLDRLPAAIEGLRLLVTYNGKRFDMPILQREFGQEFGVPHLDLCPVLHAWGHYGGLKAIERRLGIAGRTTGGLDGNDAVLLWQHYVEQGDAEALRLLLRYNASDVLTLEPLAWKAWRWAMDGYPLQLPVPPSRLCPNHLQTPWGSLAL